MKTPFAWAKSSPQDDFERLREQMVRTQLKKRGIQDRRVLAAMSQVPREEFVLSENRAAAYDDCALPIACGQTISQPYTVAFMCKALELDGSEKVLEIGAGSGYAAAVLSQLAREVHTTERLPELAEDARQRLRSLGYDNVHVHLVDGTLGLESEAPFDGIVVTAGGAELPSPYPRQLSEGGRIVIPLGGASSQTMYRYRLKGGRLEEEDLGRFAFVPLIGQHGWPET